MERFLKPERLGVDPNSAEAAKLYTHWKMTFKNFLSTLTDPNKLMMLVNFVTPTIYEVIAEVQNYEEAITTLDSVYIKPKNEVFARHMLSSCKQDQIETLDQYLRRLKVLAKECNFTAVSALKHQDDAVRDAFISGLLSGNIRQRLLEKTSLDLQTAFDSARSLEMAEKQNLSYRTPGYVASLESKTPPSNEINTSECATCAGTGPNKTTKCFFCGNDRHSRQNCPARNAICKNCEKKGHFQKVCLSKKQHRGQNSAAFLAYVPSGLSKTIIKMKVNNVNTDTLIDTGSTENFISEKVVQQRKMKILKSQLQIAMAADDLSKTTKGHVLVNLEYKNNHYCNIKLSILSNLCTDVILGHDFLKLHEKVEFTFEGKRCPLSICGLASAKIKPPALFGHLTEECRPIATKSRRFNTPDKQFISSEIQKLLKEGIIEPSRSPWRAQVLVTSNENHKKRMVVDYSQTINRFTELDAYPSTRIDELVEKVSEYDLYSTLDLKSAYHQIPLKNEEKIYTAFEASGNLYQFKRIPFGVTNGVACFQRIIDKVIKDEHVADTFAYVDNVTVCGRNKEEHDKNLAQFLLAAKKYNITFNDSKTILAAEKIQLLGYEVKKGEIKPDPERLQPLKDMKSPTHLKAQERIVGMFAYYSQWIQNFSDKAYPLIHNKTFPVPEEVEQSFNLLKKELENAVLVTIDPKVPLVVETDASDVAIAATLNQNERPVAFFSRTLSTSEKHYASVEKEAQAIVEACRKWRHYLIGNHFRLITDQRSVAFMFDGSEKGKIKNDKIQRWRLELADFKFDSVYRPGCQNVAADSFSRMHRCSAVTVIAADSFSSKQCSAKVESCTTQSTGIPRCANINSIDLISLHRHLCHPGITRMMHFIRSKNLVYSLEDVKKMTSQCSVCAEVKPQYYKPPVASLIKATQPFERLSTDFKGPLPTTSKNRYLLTIIDEYSRFPFAYPCKDMTASTVNDCFSQLFSLFGMPSFVHSDRGPSFMSKEVKDFLLSKGVATSRTTPYNPQGNGQVERLNGTLWKAITLSLKSQDLPPSHWEDVLPQALHSIRSLLCTSTNASPHERLFKHLRKSETGTTLPGWLITPGPVLMKKNVQNSKYDPCVEEVELLESNPHYAHVRLSDGRESTVSIRKLAPVGNQPKIIEPTSLARDENTTAAREEPMTIQESTPREETRIPVHVPTVMEENLIDNTSIPKCLRPHNAPGNLELPMPVGEGRVTRSSSRKQ